MTYMCYSFESNYHNWLFALFGSILFLISGHSNFNISLWIAIFTLIFSQVQVLESTIWKLLDNNIQKDANKLMKYLIPLLWLQPLAQSYLGYNATKSMFLMYMTLLYLVILVYESNESFNKNTFSVNVGENDNLVWKRYKNGKEIGLLNNTLFGLLYMAGLFVPMFFIEDEIIKYSLLSFGSISLAYSYISSSRNEYTSKWCFVSVLYIYIAFITSKISQIVKV